MKSKSLSILMFYFQIFPINLVIAIALGWLIFHPSKSIALPPPEDIPEEILRTEIITEGRSPLDGEPLTASEYEELLAQLEESPYPPEVSSQIQELIFLLNIRKFFKTFIPF